MDDMIILCGTPCAKCDYAAVQDGLCSDHLAMREMQRRIAELEFERENTANLIACAALLRQQIQFKKQTAVLPDPRGAYVSATHYDMALQAASKMAKARKDTGENTG